MNEEGTGFRGSLILSVRVRFDGLEALLEDFNVIVDEHEAGLRSRRADQWLERRYIITRILRAPRLGRIRCVVADVQVPSRQVTREVVNGRTVRACTQCDLLPAQRFVKRSQLLKYEFGEEYDVHIGHGVGVKRRIFDPAMLGSYGQLAPSVQTGLLWLEVRDEFSAGLLQ